MERDNRNETVTSPVERRRTDDCVYPRVNQTCSPFVTIKKRNIETMFETARADMLGALGPNGSGRGPAKPYRAEASKATQTANTAHNGNQSTVNRATTRCSAEPVKAVAIRS